MTRVSPRYHVLDGDAEEAFWGDVVAHCKVMGHSTMSCAKTAEPIEIPF